MLLMGKALTWETCMQLRGQHRHWHNHVLHFSAASELVSAESSFFKVAVGSAWGHPLTWQPQQSRGLAEFFTVGIFLTGFLYVKGQILVLLVAVMQLGRAEHGSC